MKQLQLLATVALSWFSAGVILLSPHASFAQGQSAKELLVGTWSLVSADSVRADAGKAPVFGANPKGTLIFTGDGHFALVQMRSDLPRVAANNRDQGTPEEYRSIVSGSIAYYGRYAFNEADKTMVLQLDGSTYANLMGNEQKRIVTKLTADDLTFTNPRNPAGATLEVSWKRAQ